MQIDFETLFANSPNPYVILDKDLILVWMNDAYLRVTMREREDLIGKPMFDAFPSDPGSNSFWQLNSSFDRVLETGEPDEIALIRYDIPKPDGRMDVRYWSATHTPLPGPEDKPEFILQHTVDVTELHNLRQLRDEVGVVERANAVEARNRDLAAASRRLMDLFEQAPGFVAALVGPTHVFQMTNEAYRDLVGRDDLLGKPVSEALPEVVGQGFLDLLDKVYRSGEPFVGRRVEVTLHRNEAGRQESRYVNFIYQPVFDEDDEVYGIIVQGNDVTEEVEYEERQALLINELNHRVKNTLAIVQGLAGQSFAQVEGAREARAIFDARLKALAAAHNLLTESTWSSAPLGDLVRRTAEASVGAQIDCIHVAGEEIALAPQTGVSLAMIIHELSTNALKYGSLSVPGGEVDIRWRLDKDGDGNRNLCFEWRELGGPPVEEPERKGFGTRLVRNGLSNEKGNRVEMKFEPEGLCCRIEAVLAAQDA